MTREYYLKHKAAMENTDWVPFEKMALYLKNAFENAPKNQIEILDAEGRWYSKTESARFLPARSYRVNPNWTGPEEPPKPEYTDSKVFEAHSIYRFIDAVGDAAFLPTAQAMAGFAGYVYYIGTPCEFVADHLIFTTQSDKNIKLKVPDAVRFRV